MIFTCDQSDREARNGRLKLRYLISDSEEGIKDLDVVIATTPLLLSSSSSISSSYSVLAKPLYFLTVYSF